MNRAPIALLTQDLTKDFLRHLIESWSRWWYRSHGDDDDAVVDVSVGG